MRAALVATLALLPLASTAIAQTPALDQVDAFVAREMQLSASRASRSPSCGTA